MAGSLRFTENNRNRRIAGLSFAGILGSFGSGACDFCHRLRCSGDKTFKPSRSDFARILFILSSYLFRSCPAVRAIQSNSRTARSKIFLILIVCFFVNSNLFPASSKSFALLGISRTNFSSAIPKVPLRSTPNDTTKDLTAENEALLFKGKITVYQRQRSCSFFHRFNSNV